MTGIFTPAYPVSKRTGSDGPGVVLAWVHVASWVVERVGPPPGAVQGKHELAAEAFAQGMLGDQGRERCDHLGVASQGQLGLDARFERGQLCEGCREALV
jgi:hypothetical protein